MQNRPDGIGNQLEIRLIGAFSVTDANGTNHALPGRKDRAVLAFLAAHRGRPVARERLVELIWPEAADGAGRASLRQSLSTIRKALSPFEVFSVDRDTVTLNSETVVTDVGQLGDVAPDARMLGTLPMTRGETLLDDLGGISADFDTWRATEQSRVSSLVGDLVDDLARQAEASNDMVRAVAALSLLVSLNPLNETAQRRYLQALIAQGQANEAIRQYRNLEKLLNDELGIRPDEKTRAVFARAKTKPGREASPDPPPKQKAADAISNPPTVVIHQFRDLSQDDENNHFAESLSGSITAALSHISGLKVIARLPSAAGSHTVARAPDDGTEAFALHGTVHRSGNRIRIGAKLVGELSGRVFWAEEYDRELNDIFSVQDDITQQIAVEMRIKLSEGEKIRVLAKFTRNIDAWTRLIRADVLINSLVEEDNIEARRLLKEAVQADPACAAAWGELADTYIGDCMMGRTTLPKAEYLEQAMRAARKALEIEPGFVHALNIISIVHVFRGDFAGANDISRKALAAAPRNPEIAANCAYVFAFCGHVDDAEEIIRGAIEDTPIPPMWYVTVQGLCHYMQGRYQAAVERLDEAVRLIPHSAFSRPYLVGALMENGAADDAARVAAEIHRIQPDFALSRWPGADFADTAVSKRLTGSLVRAGVRR